MQTIESSCYRFKIFLNPPKSHFRSFNRNIQHKKINSSKDMFYHEEATNNATPLRTKNVPSPGKN
jgi:hypothetical protein